MLNIHNTRGVTGRVRRNVVAGGGVPKLGANIPIPIPGLQIVQNAPGLQMPIPIPGLIVPNVPVNPAIITFNPVYLPLVEEEAEDQLYANSTIAELAIISGEPLEMMQIKARQLKRKREAASAEELERAKLQMYATDSMKKLGQTEAATFSKYVFSDLDGKEEFIKNYSKGVEILASFNQLRRLGNPDRNKLWFGDSSTILSENRILGDIEYRVKTDNFIEPFKTLDMWNSLKDIRIMQRKNFKFLLSLACDHVAPDGLNLASFLPVGEELDSFSALLTAFSGLDDVFTAFYDPIWTGCADMVKNKLKTANVRNANFTLVRDLLECQFRQFCTQIVTKNTSGTDKTLDSPQKCKVLFMELMVLDEAHLVERRERNFLAQKLAPYLHPIQDGKRDSKISGSDNSKGSRSKTATTTPKASIAIKSSSAIKSKPLNIVSSSTTNFICLFHMLDFFKVNSSVGNQLGPCNKRSTCRLQHPTAGPVGRTAKDLWIKSVTDSGLFYAKNPAISKQVIAAINACP